MRPSDFCLIGRSHAVFPAGIPSFRQGCGVLLFAEELQGRQRVGCLLGAWSDTMFLDIIIHLKPRLSSCLTTLGVGTEHLGTKSSQDYAPGCIKTANTGISRHPWRTGSILLQISKPEDAQVPTFNLLNLYMSVRIIL